MDWRGRASGLGCQAVHPGRAEGRSRPRPSATRMPPSSLLPSQPQQPSPHQAAHTGGPVNRSIPFPVFSPTLPSLDRPSPSRQTPNTKPRRLTLMRHVHREGGPSARTHDLFSRAKLTTWPKNGHTTNFPPRPHLPRATLRRSAIDRVRARFLGEKGAAWAAPIDALIHGACADVGSARIGADLSVGGRDLRRQRARTRHHVRRAEEA